MVTHLRLSVLLLAMPPPPVWGHRLLCWTLASTHFASKFVKIRIPRRHWLAPRVVLRRCFSRDVPRALIPNACKASSHIGVPRGGSRPVITARRFYSPRTKHPRRWAMLARLENGPRQHALFPRRACIRSRVSWPRARCPPVVGLASASRFGRASCAVCPRLSVPALSVPGLFPPLIFNECKASKHAVSPRRARSHQCHGALQAMAVTRPGITCCVPARCPA